MNFISLEFVIFFTMVVGGLQLIQPHRKKMTFLLIASYFFYAWWDVRFLLIQIIYAFLIYRLAIILANSKSGRKAILTIGIASSLVILGFFKYYNFFIESFNQVTGSNIRCLDLFLPLGISFYILSAIGYLIDVYRNDDSCQKDFICVALFLAYFPKIASGPIERSKSFWEKLEDIKLLTGERFSYGIQLILSGIIKKKMIADRLAVCVDAVFAHPSIYSAPSLICAVVSYAIQIYCDFSGYTDMAQGISYIIGLPLSRNFNLPYLSENPTEFFRRWHISLSEWMRDYIYISLGGSKKGTLNTYVNILATMLISGLWHGANWTFVVWGAVHGLGQCFYRISKKYVKINTKLAIGLNDIFVSLAWVIFRADSMSTVKTIYKGIFSWKQGVSYIYIWTIVYAIILLVFGNWSYKKNNGNAHFYCLNLEKWSSKIIFLFAICIVCALAYMGDTAFIYNNF